MFALLKPKKARVKTALIELTGGALDGYLEERPYPLPVFITRGDDVYRLFMSRPFGAVGGRFARYRIVRTP